MLRALIEAGADVMKARDDGVTALLIAARKGYENLLRALIELGADINKASDKGVRPLYFAAKMGHEAVLRALIEAGSDARLPLISVVESDKLLGRTLKEMGVY